MCFSAQIIPKHTIRLNKKYGIYIARDLFYYFPLSFCKSKKFPVLFFAEKSQLWRCVVICLIRAKLRYICVTGADQKQGMGGGEASSTIPSPELCVFHIYLYLLFNKVDIYTVQIQIRFKCSVLRFHCHFQNRKISPYQRTNMKDNCPQ